MPPEWVRVIHEMSGHAAANDLLGVAREVAPQGISLVHGPPDAAANLRDHLADNTDAATVQVARHQETIDVGQSGVITSDIEHPLERQERFEDELAALQSEIEKVANRQRAREQDR